MVYLTNIRLSKKANAIVVDCIHGINGKSNIGIDSRLYVVLDFICTENQLSDTRIYTTNLNGIWPNRTPLEIFNILKKGWVKAKDAKFVEHRVSPYYEGLILKNTYTALIFPKDNLVSVYKGKGHKMLSEMELPFPRTSVSGIAHKVFLNDRLPNLFAVQEILLTNKISFDLWSPNCNDEFELNVIELSFCQNCIFENVYSLVYLLKDTGIEKIYPSGFEKGEIKIGTFLNELTGPIGKYASAKPLSIKDFLKINPKLDTKTAINACFQPINKDLSEIDEGYHYEGNLLPGLDDYDWNKEYFDTMTDGQLGDYDDYMGGLDNIGAWAGRD